MRSTIIALSTSATLAFAASPALADGNEADQCLLDTIGFDYIAQILQMPGLHMTHTLNDGYLEQLVAHCEEQTGDISTHHGATELELKKNNLTIRFE